MYRGITAVMVAVVVSFTANAFAQRDSEVDKALKRQYPDAQTEVTDVKTVNGVKVSHVKVKTNEGETLAEVTEHGDFLIFGEPRAELAPSVREEIAQLFEKEPQNVQRYRLTNYLVEIESGERMYQLRLNAVGQLKDIKEVTKQVQAQLGNLERAPEEAVEKIRPAIERYTREGAEVKGVYKSPEGEELYIVNILQDGLNRRITVNEFGRHVSVREEIKVDNLPEPVRQAVSQMFKEENIRQVFRADEQHYEFDTRTPQGTQLTVQMRANGEIIGVRDIQAMEDEEAAVARHRDGDSGDRRRNRENRDRDNRDGESRDRQNRDRQSN